MKQLGFSSPFGSPTRTKVLLKILKDGHSWGRKIAEDFGDNVNNIQHALESLEYDGLIHKTEMGRTHVYQINRGYFAYETLIPYLTRLLEAPELRLREEN